MKILKTRDVKTPKRGTGSNNERSGGIDFFVPALDESTIEYMRENNNFDVILNDENQLIVLPGADVLIPSGIKLNLLSVSGFTPNIHNGIIMKADNKSGVATKQKLSVGATIIDEDYQGEIHLHVHNLGKKPIFLGSGDKLVQMLLIPIFIDNEIIVCENEEELFSGMVSLRGAGGFGSTNSKIKMIVAMDEYGAIGKDNGLLSEADMKHFVEYTTGKTVIMGRNTHESIGKALPNRRNIVISSKLIENPDVETMSIEEVLKEIGENKNEEFILIGGGKLYDFFLKNDLISEISLSHIITNSNEGDTFLDYDYIKNNFVTKTVEPFDAEGYVLETLTNK